MLRLYCIDCYLGPPDIVTQGAGKSFIERAFKEHACSFYVNMKFIPVEASHSMSTVERYHTPVRKAYLIVRSEAPDRDRDAAFQIAVRAVNDSAGPDGLV